MCTSYNSFGAIKTDGTLWTWGNNVNGGQLGHNNTVAYSSPTQVPGTGWENLGGSHSTGGFGMSARKTSY